VSRVRSVRLPVGLLTDSLLTELHVNKERQNEWKGTQQKERKMIWLSNNDLKRKAEDEDRWRD